MTHVFLLYLLKSTVYLSVFYLFFLLVMRQTTFFRFNRATLLAGSAVCLLLPLLKVTVAGPAPLSEVLSAAVVSGSEAVVPGGEVLPQRSGWSPAGVLLAVYAAGVAVVLALSLRSALRLLRLLRHLPAERVGGCRLYLVDGEMPSLSWMRCIVMSRSDRSRFPAILTHEQAHVACGHSIDILLFTALTAFQWFNPLVWLVRSELKLLHEYEADERVLDQGIDATQYQLLLVKKAVGEKRFLLANGFNHSQLKNRIYMIQTNPMAAWKKLFLLLVLPLVAGATLLFAESGEKAPLSLANEDIPALQEPQKQDVVPFSLVDVKPSFEGGDALAFSKWVNANLKYPEAAKDAGIQGRVTLQFTVTKDGKVENVKVLRGCDPTLDAEAVRVVSSSPDWEPGRMKGSPVNVTYTFPVVFRLSGDEAKEKARTMTLQVSSREDNE